ncbi:transketolase [Pseudonocardia sp. TRM90224]|uniref:transketolase n=1 Tax=Pseudonocardia sp. TRM90224 TaxID=2812678 RepID=UPI001E37DF32|nr:transketolase [Pseudonocardia sp. TRM90224]
MSSTLIEYPGSPPVRPADLDEITIRIREHILAMCAGPEGGHVGGSMSLVEILAALYFRVLLVDPHEPRMPERDVLLLSKGHGGIALYAVLCEAGFFPVERLKRYCAPGSTMMAHPSTAVPGVEMPTGSLGHGLGLGVGFALAAKLDGTDRRTVVVMGDGELQEGSVWESAAVASAQGLANLVAVIDRNGLQITGETDTITSLEPLADRWRAFGWRVLEVDGHDVEALADAFSAAPVVDRPTVVIAHTVKGKGIPAVENQARSHYARLSPRQHRSAVAALRAGRPS